MGGDSQRVVRGFTTIRSKRPWRWPGRRAGSGGRPAGRRHCDARTRVAPPNSLRSPAARYAQTAAASMFTMRATRADPDAALLAALDGPAPGPALRRILIFSQSLTLL